MRLRQRSDQLHAEGCFAGVVQTGFETDARVVGWGPRIEVDLGRGRVRRGLLLLLLRGAERGKRDRQCE